MDERRPSPTWRTWTKDERWSVLLGLSVLASLALIWCAKTMPPT